MNHLLKTSSLICAIFGFGIVQAGGFEIRSAGISTKGSMWSSGTMHTTEVSVTGFQGRTRVETGKAGGWLTFYNRLHDKLMLELSLGAMGRVQVSSGDWAESEVNVSGVTPITLGIQYYPLPEQTLRNLFPYVTCGGGPYWVSDVEVVENIFGAETLVGTTTSLKPGFYFGGGVHFMMTSWFGIGMDLRHHIIDMNFDHVDSGWEFGLGLEFFWGSFD